MNSIFFAGLKKREEEDCFAFPCTARATGYEGLNVKIRRSQGSRGRARPDRDVLDGGLDGV